MISDLNKVVELNPDNHEVYFLRASCLSGLFHDPHTETRVQTIFVIKTSL